MTQLGRRRTLARLAAMIATGALVGASTFVFGGATALAGAKPPVTDTCGYPTGSVARPNTTFNENEIMRYSHLTADGTGVYLLYNDEHTLTLGQSSVAHPISPWSPTYTSGTQNADQKANPSIGEPDAADAAGRPIYPSAFVTDLGTTVSPGVGSNPSSRVGDWQQKAVGTAAHIGANPPSFIAGTWKAYQGPSVNTADTVKNNYFMGPSGGTGADAVPTGLTNQGYGADIRWSFADLKLADGSSPLPGHTYRVQFMAHDGDQNRAGGDVGEGCANFDVARVAATPSIVTTGTNAVLPTGKISDSATLSGSFVATGITDIGDIVFKVYTSSDCTTGLVDTKTVTAVTGDGTYGSGAVTVTTAGTYYWQVSFNSNNTGNNGNQDAVGICGDLTGGNHEISVVTNLTYEKTVSTDNVHFAHSATANPGDTLYWKITITNTNNVAASGVTVKDDLSAALVSNSNANASLTPCAGNAHMAPDCFSYAPGVPGAGQSEIEWHGISVAANSTTDLTFDVLLNSNITGTLTLDNFVVSTTDNCVATSTDPKCKTTTDVPKTLLSVSDKLIGVSGTGTVAYNAYHTLSDCQAGTNGTSEGGGAVTAGVAAASNSVTVGPGGDFDPAVWWTATYTPNGGQPFTTLCSETASSS